MHGRLHLHRSLCLAWRSLCVSRDDAADEDDGGCRYDCKHQGLIFVPDAEWKSSEMLEWSAEDIEHVLTTAQAVLEEAATALRVPFKARLCSAAERHRCPTS